MGGLSHKAVKAFLYSMIDYHKVRKIMLDTCKAKLATLPPRKIREFAIKLSNLDQGGVSRGYGDESLLSDVEAFLIEIEEAASGREDC
jgi:hypothetical protein